MGAAAGASTGPDTGISPDPLRDQAEALLNQHIPDTTPDKGASTDADAAPSANDKSGSAIDAMQPLLDFLGIKGDPAAEAETSSPLVDGTDDGSSSADGEGDSDPIAKRIEPEKETSEPPEFEPPEDAEIVKNTIKRRRPEDVPDLPNPTDAQKATAKKLGVDPKWIKPDGKID